MGKKHRKIFTAVFYNAIWVAILLGFIALNKFELIDPQPGIAVAGMTTNTSSTSSGCTQDTNDDTGLSVTETQEWHWGVVGVPTAVLGNVDINSDYSYSYANTSALNGDTPKWGIYQIKNTGSSRDVCIGGAVTANAGLTILELWLLYDGSAWTSECAPYADPGSGGKNLEIGSKGRWARSLGDTTLTADVDVTVYFDCNDP